MYVLMGTTKMDAARHNIIVNRNSCRIVNRFGCAHRGDQPKKPDRDREECHNGAEKSRSFGSFHPLVAVHGSYGSDIDSAGELLFILHDFHKQLTHRVGWSDVASSAG